MDTEVLVGNRIEDGLKLLALLVGAGFEVSAAFWVKTQEEGLWHLYVASPSVKPETVGGAYGLVYSCLAQIPDSSIGLSEVKLIPASDPAAKVVSALRERHRAALPIRINVDRLGNLPVQEAYIYPPTRPMQVVAKGKDEVLKYLEAESLARAGKPGEYLLARDEGGDLVAMIAGHSFVGTGTIRMGGKRLDVIDGVVTRVESG